MSSDVCVGSVLVPTPLIGLSQKIHSLLELALPTQLINRQRDRMCGVCSKDVVNNGVEFRKLDFSLSLSRSVSLVRGPAPFVGKIEATSLFSFCNILRLRTEDTKSRSDLFCIDPKSRKDLLRGGPSFTFNL